MSNLIKKKYFKNIKYFDFSRGVAISDNQINAWIKRVYIELLKERKRKPKKTAFSFIACGNSIVIGHWYPSEPIPEIVITSNYKVWDMPEELMTEIQKEFK